MAKVVKSYGFFEFEFYCPGCNQNHGFRTIALPEPAGLTDRDKKWFSAKWTWNENFEAPTIAPSIHVKGTLPTGEEISVCHSFVRDGKILFLADCRHAMANQIIPLADVE